MALDHGPRHTMTCVSRFWLSGPVTREAFAAAVTAVAADSPLLAVHRRAASWLPVRFDPARQITWDDARTAVALRHLDPADTLTTWTIREGRFADLGLADADRASDHGTLVVLRYHHAVADGLAAAAAMRQVCEALVGDRVTMPTRADLAARRTLHHPVAAARRRTRWELDRIARYFRRWPAAYAPDSVTAPSPGQTPITCERLVVPADLTARLLAASRGVGATLNDLLVAALFRALRPGMRPGGVIRVAVPTSLRPRGNAAFCNQVSMVFLDRGTDATADADLLRGVSAEMNHIKRWQLGHAMHSFLAVALRAGDGPLAAFLRLPIVSATAVLSNLGEPFPAPQTAASIRVVGHDALPPLRPGTNVAVSATIHDGRLGLTVRHALDGVSPGRARDLAGRIVTESAGLVGIEADAD